MIWLLACAPERDAADPMFLWEVTSADSRTFALGAEGLSAEFSVWVDPADEGWGADLEMYATARAVDPVVPGAVTVELLQNPDPPAVLDRVTVGPGYRNTTATAELPIPPDWSLLTFRLEASPGLEVEVEVTPNLVTYLIEEDLGSATSELGFVGD